jgi:hypothetical protein
LQEEKIMVVRDISVPEKIPTIIEDRLSDIL